MGRALRYECLHQIADKEYEHSDRLLNRVQLADQAKAQGIPVFMKEDLLLIMGEERMIQELPEQFIKRIQ